MKLLRLTLNNFQGIKALSLDFGGKSAAIYGDNATGKSTVFNAYMWLLTDAAGDGAKNFSPKTMGPKGELHNLENSVEGVFEDKNGKKITLKKVFSEVWTKKRGRAAAEFGGHTTAYYIDGAPGRQSDYELAVTSLFGDRETIKMLTIPTYFAEKVKWDARRKILLEVCGDVSDEDVIASDKGLAGLPALLEGRTIDEWRKIASAKMRETNNRLDAMPGRIDEAARAIPDTEGMDEGEINAAIAELKSNKNAALGLRNGFEAGSMAEKLRRSMAELDLKIAMAEAEHARREGLQNAAALTEAGKARGEVNRLEKETAAAEGAVTRLKNEVEAIERLREATIEELNGARAQVWNEDEAVCPTCGRELPAEEVTRRRSDFNLHKSERLEAIRKRGKETCSVERIAEMKAELAGAGEKAERLRVELETAKRRVDTMDAAIVRDKPFKETEEYKALSGQRAEIEAQLSDAQRTEGGALAEFDRQIAQIDAKIERLHEGIAKLRLAETQTQRVEELKAEEAALGKAYMELENGVSLCEQFTRAKVKMLEANINDRFKTVRFRLFREQVNGGLAEDCEALIPSEEGNMVPYSTANKGARPNAGLEIISALGEHYGAKLPVFVDDAESVTRLAAIDTQIIRLVVSAADKTLRMEKE